MSPGLRLSFTGKSPVRIAGPCVSMRMPTIFAVSRAALRMRGTMARTQSWGAWLMLSRKQFTPVSMRLRSISGDSVAGPSVAMIFVLRMMFETLMCPASAVHPRMRSHRARRGRLRQDRRPGTGGASLIAVRKIRRVACERGVAAQRGRCEKTRNADLPQSPPVHRGAPCCRSCDVARRYPARRGEVAESPHRRGVRGWR